MNLLTTDPLVTGCIVLSIAVLILLGMVVRMHIKLRRFLITADAHHIGDSLTHVSGSLSELQHFRAEMEKYLSGVEKRLRTSIRSVDTIRFNPFKGTGSGGNQSFVTTLVNEEGTGVVMSSLYSRDHVSVFSKPVKAFGSEFELSQEERDSLNNARKGLN